MYKYRKAVFIVYLQQKYVNMKQKHGEVTVIQD